MYAVYFQALREFRKSSLSSDSPELPKRGIRGQRESGKWGVRARERRLTWDAVKFLSEPPKAPKAVRLAEAI